MDWTGLVPPLQPFPLSLYPITNSPIRACRLLVFSLFPFASLCLFYCFGKCQNPCVANWTMPVEDPRSITLPIFTCVGTPQGMAWGLVVSLEGGWTWLATRRMLSARTQTLKAIFPKLKTFTPSPFLVGFALPPLVLLVSLLLFLYSM